jgi:hypothetical protein
MWIALGWGPGSIRSVLPDRSSSDCASPSRLSRPVYRGVPKFRSFESIRNDVSVGVREPQFAFVVSRALILGDQSHKQAGKIRKRSNLGCVFKDANCFEPCHLLSRRA